MLVLSRSIDEQIVIGEGPQRGEVPRKNRNAKR